MALISSYANGQFCWVDLMTTDLAAAKKFYGELFGWEPDVQDTQGGPPYVCFRLNGKQVAGLGEMNDEMTSSGAPPVWNSYIAVDDVEAVTQKAASLGGNVAMPPFKVMEAGHMSIVQDPTRAFVSFWQKLQHGGAEHVNDPNTWVWNELLTGKPDDAIKFYGDLLGWTFEKEQNSPTNYWMITNAQRMNGGIMELTPDLGPIPPHWAVYFNVADIRAAIEKVKQLGGSIMKEPFEVSVGHIAVAADAQGAAFALIQMSVPVDD